MQAETAPAQRRPPCPGWLLTLLALILAPIACLPGIPQARASTYTITSPFGSGMQRLGDGPVEFRSVLPVGRSGALVYRSALDYDLRSLPDTEKVVAARIELQLSRGGIQGLNQPVGSIRVLDPAAPLRFPDRPVDPFRFSWDAISAAPFLGSMGLGGLGQGGVGSWIPFDVTAALAARHLADAVSSPFGLLDNPDRTSGLGYVDYATQSRLVVETAPPDAVDYALEYLGGTRWRATYDLKNEVSVALSLIDLEFEPALYDEASVAVLPTGPLAGEWDALFLDSGVDVPAVVSLVALGDGLAGGQSARGFQVEFDWLGESLPSAQGYTVYDPLTYEVLYAGRTSFVPLPRAAWLMGAAFVSGLGFLRRKRPPRG